MKTRRKSSKRPFRLLGTKPGEAKGANIPHACYVSELSAHNGALLRTRWGDFRTIEVYDVRTGKESGTYKLTSDGHLSFSTPFDSTIARLIKERKDG